MEGIKKIEAASEQPRINMDVEEMIKEYRKLYPNPIWSLVEDIQRQAMIYSNVIEEIKSGKTAAETRTRYQSLELVPGAILPNPDVADLFQKAFSKVSTFRRALVDIVKGYGGKLLNELSFEIEQTVTVGVNIGFPPSISIAVEHSAKSTTVTRF